MTDQDLVLAITDDDRMVHVGTSAWILTHVLGAGGARTAVQALHPPAGPGVPGGLRLHAADGRALEPAPDGSSLVPAGAGDVDPVVLVGRVDTVLARAREHLAAHPELGVSPDVVPGASGPLPAVLAVLDAYGGGDRPGRRPPRSWRETIGRVWSVSVGRLAPEVAPRLAPLVARLPGLGGVGSIPDVTTGPPTPPVPPVLDPDGVPHNGGWFHNLMHRLAG